MKIVNHDGSEGQGNYFIHAGNQGNDIVVTWPYSDEHIIALHDQLLISGEHRIMVPSLDVGRMLIQPLVASMNNALESAFLSVEHTRHETSALDIYEEIVRTGCLLQPSGLEELLRAFWNIDFLWIEETAQLRATSWYTDCLALMKDFGYAEHMSIAHVICL